MKKKQSKLNGLRKSKLKKQLGEKCVYCGCTNKIILTIDHIIPLGRGGKDVEKNKQVCCFICNQLKGTLKHGEFKEYMKALNILQNLNKLYFEMVVPKLRVNTTAFPLEEKHILKEIEKDFAINKEKKE